jgi:hypothetical protein
MEKRVIPEPQRTYVLELLHALGPAASGFVVAGAQAMKFIVDRARATKDIDFVLDVVRLRAAPLSLGTQLKQLGYVVVDGARNFQFQKPIPNSSETMRIEFMAPEEYRRGERDFRVGVQKGVHARALPARSAVALCIWLNVFVLPADFPCGNDFMMLSRLSLVTIYGSESD